MPRVHSPNANSEVRRHLGQRIRPNYDFVYHARQDTLPRSFGPTDRILTEPHSWSMDRRPRKRKYHGQTNMKTSIRSPSVHSTQNEVDTRHLCVNTHRSPRFDGRGMSLTKNRMDREFGRLWSGLAISRRRRGRFRRNRYRWEGA